MDMSPEPMTVDPTIEQGEEFTSAPLAPRHITKLSFARRIHQLRLKKGWSQSELARRAGLTRDAISTYATGKSFPTSVSLKRLAEALGVKPEELLPNQIEAAIDEDTPALEIKASPNAPTKAWLRVNRLVKLSTAVKIAELIENDDVLD